MAYQSKAPPIPPETRFARGDHPPSTYPPMHDPMEGLPDTQNLRRRHSMAASARKPPSPRCSSPLTGPVLRGDGVLEYAQEESYEYTSKTVYRPSRISSTPDMSSLSHQSSQYNSFSRIAVQPPVQSSTGQSADMLSHTRSRSHPPTSYKFDSTRRHSALPTIPHDHHDPHAGSSAVQQKAAMEPPFPIMKLQDPAIEAGPEKSAGRRGSPQRPSSAGGSAVRRFSLSDGTPAPVQLPTSSTAEARGAAPRASPPQRPRQPSDEYEHVQLDEVDEVGPLPVVRRKRSSVLALFSKDKSKSPVLPHTPAGVQSTPVRTLSLRKRVSIANIVGMLSTNVELDAKYRDDASSGDSDSQNGLSVGRSMGRRVSRIWKSVTVKQP